MRKSYSGCIKSIALGKNSLKIAAGLFFVMCVVALYNPERILADDCLSIEVASVKPVEEVVENVAEVREAVEASRGICGITRQTGLDGSICFMVSYGCDCDETEMDYFEIYRSTTKKDVGTRINLTSDSEGIFTDLAAGKTAGTYFYRVRCIKAVNGEFIYTGFSRAEKVVVK